jgi:hypothetical protein
VPDGYTMLTAFSSFVINPAVFARIPYDPVNDFDPVSLAINSLPILPGLPVVPLSPSAPPARRTNYL